MNTPTLPGPLTDEQIRDIGNSLPPEHQFHGRVFARAIEAAVVAAVRERCAKAADDFLTSVRSPLGRSVADAIRKTPEKQP
jgi:hypothetical protein